MTTANAIKLVIRAAEANANGHEDCRQILEAVAKIRELFKLMKKGKAK